MKEPAPKKQAKPKTKAKSQLDMAAISDVEAKRILLLLVEEHKELVPIVEALALSVNTRDRFDVLAREIESALNHITEDAVWGRSGRSWDGYREPSEAAAELISKQLAPYFERLGKLAGESDPAESLSLCLAIIRGLYVLSHGDGSSEFEECVSFCCEEDASFAKTLFLTAGQPEISKQAASKIGRKFPPDFVSQYAPEWTWLNG